MDRTSYKGTTEWLFGLKRFSKKHNLTNIRRLLKLLRDPHKAFKSIHVTGTNGKGSTAAMMASILAEAGYKVGIYTSPHLSSFTERIVVDGRKIPESEVVRLASEIMPLMDEMAGNDISSRPSYFEVVTAMALKYFAEKKVDFGVVEVGMGGRLDATNVIRPLVSVITNVSLEHTGHLGNTVAKIAREKAGIIEKGVPLVTAADDKEVIALLEKMCRKKGSEIFLVGRDMTFKKTDSSLDGQRFMLKNADREFDLYTPLLGRHQLKNAAVAVCAMEALGRYGIKIPERAVRDGLNNVKWPGRLEVVQKNPLVVLDCAKDPVAAENLRDAILDNFKFKRLFLVMSVSSDKDIPSMVRNLAPISDMVIAAEHKTRGRAAKAGIITREVERCGRSFTITKGVKDAVRKALSMAGKGDMVCVTGSVFTVGEARELWHKDVDFMWGRELND